MLNDKNKCCIALLLTRYARGDNGQYRLFGQLGIGKRTQTGKHT